MIRIRILLAVFAFALPIPAVVAGCGGDDSTDEDPQQILDAIFNNDTQVSSGNLDLSVSVAAEGDQGGSFDASLSGPFQGDPENANAVPQLDWTVSASGEGGGQSIDFEGGVVLTADNAFVEYQGEAYEVGADVFGPIKEQLEAQAGTAGGDGASSSASFQEGCAQAIEQAGGDPAACDIDLQSWLTNLSNEGTEDVEGTETAHIHGDADIDQILADIGDLAGSIPGAEAQGFDPAQLGLVSDAVTEAAIDVYGGTEDDILRRLDANLAIDPTAIPGGEAAGVSSVDLSFSLTLAGVNEEQTIEAPSGAKPIDELLSQFGIDLGSLGALGALGGGGIPGGLGGGGGGGSSSAYLDCIAQATTPDEITACASQITP